jgi:ferredoxin-thioredoxin reductase catalytic subunit
MNRPQRTTVTLAIEQQTVERIAAWQAEQAEKIGVRLSMNAAANALLKHGLAAEQSKQNATACPSR